MAAARALMFMLGGGLLAAGSAALCGDERMTLQSVPSGTCGAASVSGERDWASCCVFDAAALEPECRAWSLNGTYCSDPDCSWVGRKDRLRISVAFEASAEERCCKSCTCYGDPECVSFENKQDVWIPCDARGSSEKAPCTIRKTTCEATTGPNGETCRWLSKKQTGRGWDIANRGSPCVPDLEQEVMMSMYRKNKFEINLSLGERGIIRAVHVRDNAKEYVLDAQRCFDLGADAWAGDETPAGWVHEDRGPRAVLWTVFHAAKNVRAVLLCVRSAGAGNDQAVRINVQEVTVSPEDSSSGFCASGVIADKRGDTDHSMALHRYCHQDRATALQACKFLVSFGSTPNELARCAQVYCSAADVKRVACEKALGDGATADAWTGVYCDALVRRGVIAEHEHYSCARQVEEQGWDYAVSTWGRGYRPPVDNRECGSSLKQYALEERGVCDGGVYVDVQGPDGEWEPRYFIPTHLPPCGGVLTVRGDQDRSLFTMPVALRQCSAGAGCSELSSCAANVGVRSSLDFVDAGEVLAELEGADVLRCAPREEEGVEEPDVTWCLPSGGAGGAGGECTCTCA